VAQFRPSTPNDRTVLLLAASRQALDAIEGALVREGQVPAWVENRLQRSLIELRMAGAFADAKPRAKTFTPSGAGE